MSRGPRWITSACLATGCAIASLALSFGVAAAAATVTPAPANTTPHSTTTPSTTTSAPAPAPAPTTTTAPATTTTALAVADPFQPVLRSAASAHVSIVDFGFSPASITVTAGTTVTWTNTGSVIHSVTSDSGAFDSSPSCPTGACINPGSSYSHVFSTAGTFTYHCRVHSTMHGTVIVTAAAPVTTPTTAPASGGGAGASSTVAAQASGPQLAFTGASSREAWIAFGALFTIALGLALRPRRRPFPVPVPSRTPKVR